ncbi:MAG: TetR-like C-terminal domain-containing protein, partial [Dermatophilaceae bacterium]
GHPLDELEALGRAYLAFARAERGCFAVMWREDLQDPADPSLREASAATLAVIVELAARVADSSGAQRHGTRRGGSGSATTRHDPAMIATVLWSAAHGFADLSRYGALDDLVGGPGAGDDAFLALLRSLFAGLTRTGAT